MKSFAADLPVPTKRKASKIMWVLSALCAVVAATGFAAFFIGLQFGITKARAFAVLTVVGFSLEGALWTAAAAIGVTVIEARKRIWRAIVGRGNQL